jgi:hypothetical protein
MAARVYRARRCPSIYLQRLSEALAPQRETDRRAHRASGKRSSIVSSNRIARHWLSSWRMRSLT